MLKVIYDFKFGRISYCGQNQKVCNNYNLYDEFISIENDDEDSVLSPGEQNMPTDLSKIVKISWGNIHNGRIFLLPKDYKFPDMNLQNLVTMWYCGDKGKGISPYRVLKEVNMKSMGNKSRQFPMMKKLIQHV